MLTYTTNVKYFIECRFLQFYTDRVFRAGNAGDNYRQGHLGEKKIFIKEEISHGWKS